MSQQASSPQPTSETTGVFSIYDTYLCREPADDVPLLIHNGPDDYTALMRTLQRSADYFAERDQLRAVERLQWEMAKVHIQHQQWERAARVLTPLWQTLSWRKAGWWRLVKEVAWALRDCASRVRNLETLITVNWELLCKSLTPRQDWDYDFSRSLEPLKPFEMRPRAVVKADNLLSCLSATFAFSAPEGNVGENLQSQVLILSRAQNNSNPLVVSSIKVAFGGSLRNFAIHHKLGEPPGASTADGSFSIHKLSLQNSPPNTSLVPSSPSVTRGSQFASELVSSADLTLSPAVTKAFTINHIPRDAGEVEVESIALCLSQDEFDLEVIFTEDDQIHQEEFWIATYGCPVKKIRKSGRSSTVKIFPKPPKLRIGIDNAASTYYTDEDIVLNVLTTNDEEEEAVVTLESRLVGALVTLPKIMWTTARGEDEVTLYNTAAPLDQAAETPISKAIGSLTASSKHSSGIRIGATSEATEYNLEVRARYHLVSDPETPVSKLSSIKIKIQSAFEASHKFCPMIDTRPWPSYFDVGEPGQDIEGITHTEGQLATGLTQQWSLTSSLFSLASMPLGIERIELRMLELHEAAVCNISPCTKQRPGNSLIAPNDIHEHEAIVEVQKTDLEDRRSTFIGLRLEVTWRRQGCDDPSAVTYLTVPELVIPFGEPRVLAIPRNGETPSGVIHLDYVIENPSTYALTFSLTMDTSEEFAFSGPKNVAVELVPLSRHTVRYNLMPLVKGVWITPQFRVFDTHFRKALKVNATKGMRSDKKGLSIWVDANG